MSFLVVNDSYQPEPFARVRDARDLRGFYQFARNTGDAFPFGGKVTRVCHKVRGGGRTESVKITRCCFAGLRSNYANECGNVARVLQPLSIVQTCWQAGPLVFGKVSFSCFRLRMRRVQEGEVILVSELIIVYSVSVTI